MIWGNELTPVIVNLQKTLKHGKELQGKKEKGKKEKNSKYIMHIIPYKLLFPPQRIYHSLQKKNQYEE